MRGWQLGSVVASLAIFALMCSSLSQPHAEPPPPTEAGAGNGSVSTFAIDSLSLGDVDDAGHQLGTAWKLIGYDLDGRITSKDSTDVCDLQPGAPLQNQVDGVGGRDNAFGAAVVPLLTTFVNPFCLFCADAGPPTIFLSNVETTDIRNGKFTLQIRTAGLVDDPAQDATGLTADVFTSDVFDGTTAPLFDSSTDWPVQADSLADSSTLGAGALAHFSSAYVTHGTFVAGMNENVTVPLHAEINGIPFTIAIHDAIITFDHVDANDAANGVLAGVLDTEEFIAVFRAAAPRGAPALCGSAFDIFAGAVRANSDILADRQNQPHTTCTSISVGIGFHAKRVANPTKIGLPPPLPPDPCTATLDAAID